MPLTARPSYNAARTNGERLMRRIVLLVCGVAGILSGCAALSDVLRTAFAPPTLRFKSVELSNVTLDALALDTIWSLENPNAIGVSLASVEYRLSVEGQQVVAGAPARGLQVAPNASSDLHFPAELRFRDLAQLGQALWVKEFAHYRAEGSIGIETPIGVLSLPMSTEGEFEIPRVPKLELLPVRVTRIDLSGAAFEFPLIFTNRNSFVWPDARLTGTVTIAGVRVGTVALPSLGAIPGHGTKQVSIPLQVSFLSAAGAVVSAVRSGSAPVQMDVQLEAGGQRVPVQVDQLVQFLR
jgi:LEA14-like dessication related protein